MLALLRLIHSAVTCSFRERFSAFIALKAEETKHEYTRMLKMITKRVGPPELINEDAAMRFIAERKLEVADTTLLQETRWLHGIWAKCLPRKANPWDAPLQNLPRFAKGVRPTLPANYADIYAYGSTIPTNKTELRDHCLIMLGFSCGLRRRELWALNFNSVKRSESGLCYLELPHTKSGAAENTPVRGQARKLLESLLLQRASEGAAGDDPLFVNYFMAGRKNTRISYVLIGRIFHREVGIAPHRARCSFICKLRSEGVDLDATRRAARLRSVQMVILYDRREIALDELKTPQF